MSLEPAGGGGRRRAATAPPGALARLRRPPEGLWRGSGSGCREGSPAPMPPAAAEGLPLRRALPEPPPRAAPRGSAQPGAARGWGRLRVRPEGTGTGTRAGGLRTRAPRGQLHGSFQLRCSSGEGRWGGGRGLDCITGEMFSPVGL